jgi:hypothetical protein
MLFHFSFYWNKHPSLPAAGDELAMEPGLHHLSPVKFPKIAVVQPSVSVSGLVSRNLRLGLGATRANLVPALCVEALMVSLVLAYFYVPVARPFFNVLSDWNVRGGLAFSFIAMGATVGGLTETFIVYLHKGGRWTREDLMNMTSLCGARWRSCPISNNCTLSLSCPFWSPTGAFGFRCPP